LEKKIIGAIGIFRNITREKEIDRAKSEFISIASHQLRTPVSALNWLLESVRFSLQKLTPQQQQNFDDMESAVRRLVKLVEDLLSVSRIEAGAAGSQVEQLALEKAVQDVIDDFMPYTRQHEHTLRYNIPNESFLVVADRFAIRHILQNLLTNAVDYSPRGSTVTVSVMRKEHEARVGVMNEGPAISPEDQKGLFEKFYRGTTGRTSHPEGSGLGLYIVKSLVERMHGTFNFSSAEGSPTEFWFTIPLIR
jgi:signal transduction histidine kinase